MKERMKERMKKNMKRSQHVLIPRLRKATLPGRKRLSLVIASLIASGCSFKEEAHIFKTVDECKSASEFSEAECVAAYEKAMAEAERTAPRYRSMRDCEYEFGRHACSRSSSAGSYFIPVMAGFMISEAFRRNNYSQGYNPLFTYYDRGYQNGRSPIWTTADGSQVAKGSKSTASVGKATLKPKPKATRTMSRGGFGSKAAAKSSWGGRSSRGGWGG